MKKFFLLIGMLVMTVCVMAGTVVIIDTATDRVLEIKHSQNSPDYRGRDDVLFNPVIPSTPTKFMIHDNGNLRGMTEAEMDSLLLDEEKEIAKADWDQWVTQSMNDGFVYDGSTFSLTAQAQSNWMGLYTARDYLDYPVQVTEMNGTNYTIGTATGVVSFYLEGVGNVKGLYDYARTRKGLIDDCTYYRCVEGQ